MKSNHLPFLIRANNYGAIIDRRNDPKFQHGYYLRFMVMLLDFSFIFHIDCMSGIIFGSLSHCMNGTDPEVAWSLLLESSLTTYSKLQLRQEPREQQETATK